MAASKGGSKSAKSGGGKMKMDAEDRADLKRTGKMPTAAEEKREAKKK